MSYLSLCLLLPVKSVSGAVSGTSPPSCVSITGDASRQTAAETVTVSMDAVSVSRAGRVLAVILWCVSHQPAVLMVSALPVSEDCFTDH